MTMLYNVFVSYTMDIYSVNDMLNVWAENEVDAIDMAKAEIMADLYNKDIEFAFKGFNHVEAELAQDE